MEAYSRRDFEGRKAGVLAAVAYKNAISKRVFTGVLSVPSSWVGQREAYLSTMDYYVFLRGIISRNAPKFFF